MRLDRDWWVTPPAEPIAPTWVLGVVAAGIGYVFVNSRVDGPAQTVAMVGLVAGALAVARAGGLSLDDLGLGCGRVRSGLRWGLAVGAAAAAAIVLAALVPGLESLFEDDRYAGATGGEVLYEVLVRIPIGTALFEEVLFRGVVLGLLLRQVRPGVAVALSSMLFGLWHVVAATGFADANAGVPDAVGTGGVVAVTVVATAAAGVLLAWLRIRSGSVAAPLIVHTAVNSTAVIVAAVVTG